jgi:hypothetical protein
MDVLSASNNDNKIAWYKNSGGSPPAWTPYTISTTASGAVSVCAAFVDGDALRDVLSASFNDNRIAWYKNGGGSPPTWTPYTITSAATYALSVYALDVDGDSFVDALSASYNDSTVAWYKNSGGSPPSWTPITITTSASAARSVFAADVSGDGIVDVLSASEADNTIAWYAGNSCPRGRYGAGGVAPCFPCLAGRYASDSAQASCTACPSGRYGNVTGAVNATVGCPGTCPAGFYSSGPGARACTVCPLYTTSSTVGATACLPACPTAGQLSVT